MAVPQTRDIGVVLLTGLEGGTSAAAMDAGADAYLLKPFSPLELLSVVERLAGGLHATPRGTSRFPRSPLHWSAFADGPLRGRAQVRARLLLVQLTNPPKGVGPKS